MADTNVDLTEFNGGKLITTVAVFLVLSWISVGLRTYTRAILTKSFQLDDWLMLLSQVSNLPFPFSHIIYTSVADI